LSDIRIDFDADAVGGAQAQSPSGSAVPVTVENFVRAESDLIFLAESLTKSVSANSFIGVNFPPDGQTGMRPNRDTLYSGAVFDLSAGPVTISLPNAGNRCMLMQVIDEDNFKLHTRCNIWRGQLHLQ
jgi:hypothetical protein